MGEKKKKSSLKKFIAILILIVLAIAAGFLYGKFGAHNEPKITGNEIESTIREASDLTTAYMDYKGFIKFTDGEIPLLTKKAFTMVYNAKIEAGVDLSGAKVKVTDKKVTVEIPAAEVQSIKVDQESIEFYDERFALFNWTSKEDIPDAVKKAEENTEEKADIKGLLANADRHTEKLIKGGLKAVVPEKEIVVKKQ